MKRHTLAQPTKSQRKAALLGALAEFLGGTNQARMSIALQMGRGELYEVATLWMRMRDAVPGMRGYPTQTEALAVLEDFLP